METVLNDDSRYQEHHGELYTRLAMVKLDIDRVKLSQSPPKIAYNC